MLGHVFNPWLRLRGGKGVATAAGAIGALAPRLLVGPLAFFVIVFALRRRVSEASIAAALMLPVGGRRLTACCLRPDGRASSC